LIGIGYFLAVTFSSYVCPPATAAVTDETSALINVSHGFFVAEPRPDCGGPPQNSLSSSPLHLLRLDLSLYRLKPRRTVRGCGASILPYPEPCGTLYQMSRSPPFREIYFRARLLPYRIRKCFACLGGRRWRYQNRRPLEKGLTSRMQLERRGTMH